MSVRGRIIIWVIGLVLGVPTSLYGLQWMQFKYLKQEVDCITDVNNATITWLANVEPNSAGSQFDVINSNFKSCVKEIDASKGTIKFAEEQYKRYH